MFYMLLNCTTSPKSFYEVNNYGTNGNLSSNHKEYMYVKKLQRPYLLIFVWPRLNCIHASDSDMDAKVPIIHPHKAKDSLFWTNKLVLRLL